MPNTKKKYSYISFISIIVSIFLLISGLNLSILGENLSTPSSDQEENANTASRGNRADPSIISLIWDEPYDEDNDTTYDFIHLGVKFNISNPDTYVIYATLIPSGIPEKDFFKKAFSVGPYETILKFSGTEIYKNGVDGPYNIEISIYDGDGNLIEERDYETGFYSFEDFNPSAPGTAIGLEEITVVNNTIELRNRVFVAVIYELSPMIIFFYTSDDGKTARFKVTYNSIICFNDDGDGKFQNNELRYWGDLINSRWNSPKMLMENFNNFNFQVQTIVDILDENNQPVDTKLELVFHYSSLTKATNPDSARKFDISMKVLGSPFSGITHISLLHNLEDEMGNHEFLESADGNKISFMTQDNKEHGYYSWKDFIEVTTNTGETSVKDVDYNFRQNSEPNILYLYLNYPYSMDTTEIFHDPEVGVDPKNAPRPPGVVEPDIISHNKWLIIYFIVAIIASSVMIGNIYRQKKKRGEY
jgi:hypothetical protein